MNVQVQVQPPRTSWIALASLLVGILVLLAGLATILSGSLLFFFGGLIAVVLAWILGFLGLLEIMLSHGKVVGLGLVAWGTVLPVLGVIGTAILAPAG